MIKTLVAANKSEKMPFKVPQQSIPVQMIYPDGTWQVGLKHSKTWRFTDINYASASEADQKRIFKSYCGVINSLPTDASCKITIVNHRLNPVDFKRTMLMKDQGDGLDHYRHESNQILLGRATLSNNLVQDKTLQSPSRNERKRTARTIFPVWTPISPRASTNWPPTLPFSATRIACGCSTISSVPVRSSFTVSTGKLFCKAAPASRTSSVRMDCRSRNIKTKRHMVLQQISTNILKNNCSVI